MLRVFLHRSGFLLVSGSLAGWKFSLYILSSDREECSQVLVRLHVLALGRQSTGLSTSFRFRPSLCLLGHQSIVHLVSVQARVALSDGKRIRLRMRILVLRVFLASLSTEKERGSGH